MTEIPMPEALEPEFAHQEVQRATGGGDKDSAVDELGRTLEELSAYARHLWEELDATRNYLMQQVANGGDAPVVGSQPMLQTDEHWAVWVDRYTAIFSVLAGPKGDEGLGGREAMHQANMQGHLLSPEPPRMSPTGT